MDGSRFDSIVKRLAERPTRRHVLRSLGGGLAGGVLALAGAGRADAAPCKRPNTTCGKGRTAVCTNTSIDPNNCGTCGTACGPNQLCTNGHCVTNLCAGVVCPENSICASFTRCDPATGQCQYVPNNEGAPCDDGSACTIDTVCQNGVCTGGTVTTCDNPATCQGAGSCNATTGQCDYPVDAGSCFIFEQCYADGQHNPFNDCEVCDVSRSQTGWTNVATGLSCLDHNGCATGTCQPDPGGSGFQVCVGTATVCGPGATCGGFDHCVCFTDCNSDGDCNVDNGQVCASSGCCCFVDGPGNYFCEPGPNPSCCSGFCALVEQPNGSMLTQCVPAP